MRRGLIIAVALASAAAVHAADKLQTGNGTVTYINTKEAFFDAGSQDGIVVGEQAKIFRRKKQIGTCEVVEVTLVRSRCKSDKVIPGDRIQFVRNAAPPPRDTTPAVVAEIDKTLKRPEALPTDSELKVLRDVVQAVPVEKVAKKPQAQVGGVKFLTRASAALRQEVWTISTAAGDTFPRTSLDAGLYTSFVAPVVQLPLYAETAFRVTSDALAPFQRSRLGEYVEMYLWSAAVGIEATGSGVVGAVGRFRPRMAPGALLLDGAQLGARFGAAEVGVYGGTIPDLLFVYPAQAPLTAGAYFGIDVDAGAGVIAYPRARLALLSSLDAALVRGELEASTELYAHGVGTFGVEAKVGTAAAPEVVPVLEGFRTNGELTLFSPFRVQADYRYLAAPQVDFDAIFFGLAPHGAAHNASVTGSAAIGSGFVIGAVSGVGYDVVGDAFRGYIGPEVGLPEAFGSLGGMDFGYLEELGDQNGRSAWVGARVTPEVQRYPLSIITRVSYFETAARGDNFREAALMTLFGMPLAPGVGVQARLYLQQDFASVDTTARATPSLMMADVGVTGSL